MVARFAAILAAALGIGAAAIAEIRTLTWEDLAPPAVEYANPFENIEQDQMNGLRDLLRLRMRIDGGETDLAGEAAALQAVLENAGLDVEWLFAKRLEIMEIREAAATGVNENLIGESVRMPGYLLPLELKDRRAVEFLLVPTVGACIHTPPPPANQVVHVRYPMGVEISGLYDPIWIEGELAAQSTMQDVRYVDGEAKVQVSYAMDAVSVVPYRQK